MSTCSLAKDLAFLDEKKITVAVLWLTHPVGYFTIWHTSCYVTKPNKYQMKISETIWQKNVDLLFWIKFDRLFLLTLQPWLALTREKQPIEKYCNFKNLFLRMKILDK